MEEGYGVEGSGLFMLLVLLSLLLFGYLLCSRELGMGNGGLSLVSQEGV